MAFVTGNWTYSGDPASSNEDAVRFECGDTDANDKLLSDNEISYCLSGRGVLQAAAVACDSIARKFARKADYKTGDLRVTASQKAEAYRKQAEDLRQRIGREEVSFYSGGQSKDEKDSDAEDTDLIQPAFRVGQDDSPGTLGDSTYEDIHGN